MKIAIIYTLMLFKTFMTCCLCGIWNVFIYFERSVFFIHLVNIKMSPNVVCFSHYFGNTYYMVKCINITYFKLVFYME